MVKIYVADIKNLPDPMLHPELLYRLSQGRQQRIHNMKQEKSRKQSVGVGLLLQKVLALYHMEDSQVFVGEHGKPMIDGLEFSLSHSDDLVICAVSDRPIGCDVEKIRKAPKGVAERYFSCGEQEYLNRFAEEKYDTAFFRLWTIKESYVKMTGEGMGLALGEYEIMIDACAKVLRDGETQECYISEVDVPGYIISICAKSSNPVDVIWENL